MPTPAPTDPPAAPAEAQPQIAAEQLGVILAAMHDGVVTAEQRTGRIVLVNQAMSRLTGRSRAELLGMTVWDLHPRQAHAGVARDFGRPQDPSKPLARIRTLLLRADGGTTPVEIASGFVEQASGVTLRVGTFRDVSAQEATEQAGRAALHRYQTLLDQLPGPVLCTELESQTVVLANQAMGALFGCEPADLVGQPTETLHPAHSHPMVREAFARVARGQLAGVVRQVPIQRRDTGEQRTVDVMYTVVQQAGQALVLGQFLEVQPDPALPGDEPYAAWHDPVSGLLSPQGFRAEVEAQLRGDPAQAFTLVRFDLDDFHALSGGDPARGSRLLKAVGARLAEACPEGPIARVERDEFAALMPKAVGQTLEQQTEALIDQVLGAPLQFDGSLAQLRATAAVTAVQGPDAAMGDVMRRLRAALDGARLSDSGRLVSLQPSERLSRRQAALQAIRVGIARDEFVLHYQPQVRLDRDEAVAAEALVRWRHPEHGLLLPGRFLPDLLHTALWRRLGDVLLAQTLDQAVGWRRAGLQLPISMNLSGAQLTDSGFVDQLLTTLRERPDLDPAQLQVEVLESSALELTGPLLGNMRRLAAAGVELAIDDFGTGYASLSVLHALPVRTVKIDKSFVLAMPADVQQAVIVDGVLGMARALLRDVVAEGVETVELGVRLIQMGCRVAQGFAIAKAMPADAIPGWVDRWARPPAWRQAHPVSRARLHALFMRWEHQAWRQRVLQRAATALPDHLGEADPTCMLGRWLAAHPEPDRIQLVDQVHSHVHRLADKLLLAPPAAPGHDPRVLQFMAWSDKLLGLIERFADVLGPSVELGWRR